MSRRLLCAAVLCASLACGGPSSSDGGAGGGAGGGSGGGTGGGLGGGSGGGGAVDAGCVEVDLADGGCEPLAFSSLCGLRDLYVVLDGYPVDDAAGRQLSAAVRAHCTPPPTSLEVPNDGGLPRVLDGGSPTIGKGPTLVAGGGGYYQPHVQWLEDTGAARVVDVTTSSTASFLRRDGGVLFSEPLSGFDGGVDYFLLQLVRGRPTGPLSLVGYGVFGTGTSAAAWFFSNRVAPHRASWTDSWYVVRWVDADAGGLPDDGDTFTVLGSGP